MKKPTLALHTAASHAPSLHCTGMLKDQSVASHVIKKKILLFIYSSNLNKFRKTVNFTGFLLIKA